MTFTPTGATCIDVQVQQCIHRQTQVQPVQTCELHALEHVDWVGGLTLVMLSWVDAHPALLVACFTCLWVAWFRGD